MRSLVLLFLLLALCSVATASPSSFLIKEESFQEGQSWIWSYSEKIEGSEHFQKPYLYEKYLVTNIREGLVTIEMFSAPNMNFSKPAHHKFIADVGACLAKGSVGSEKVMRSWKISFYTRSLGSDWSLLSKNFKNLAFTEKFNCFSEVDEGSVRAFKIKDREFAAKQNGLGFVDTWFADEAEHLSGVGVLRFANNFKVELVDFD